MFRACARAAGVPPGRHALLTLGLKGAARVAAPVLQSNIERCGGSARPRGRGRGRGRIGWGQAACLTCALGGVTGCDARATAGRGCSKVALALPSNAHTTPVTPQRASPRHAPALPPPVPLRAPVGVGHGARLSSSEGPEDASADAVRSGVRMCLCACSVLVCVVHVSFECVSRAPSVFCCALGPSPRLHPPRLPRGPGVLLPLAPWTAPLNSLLLAPRQAASMVPEYLTPMNGGLLAPGQMAAVARAVCARMAGGPAGVCGAPRPARRCGRRRRRRCSSSGRRTSSLCAAQTCHPPRPRHTMTSQAPRSGSLSWICPPTSCPAGCWQRRRRRSPT